MTFIMTIRRDYMTMAWLDMTWAMTMTALHIYIMAFILLINIMRRFHGLYAHLRMARFHALIQMGGTHLHCVQRTVSFLKDGESLTSSTTPCAALLGPDGAGKKKKSIESKKFAR